MDSPAAVHKSYQRFFAWTFVLATVLALALIWVELAFPPAPSPPPMTAPAPAAGEFNLHELQLLLTVAALIAAFASLAGLAVTTPLAWLDRRKARARAALELALKRQDHINWVAAEHTGTWPTDRTTLSSAKPRRGPRRIHGRVHPG